MRIISKILPVLAVAVALFCAPLYAQFSQGTIRGRVLDREGKPLQGAVVRIESLATRLSDDAKTNRNGDYSLSGLYQGQYKATVIVDGRAVMVKGDGSGDAIYVGAGDVSVGFDLRKAPATPPPTPAAPLASADKSKTNDKADDEMRKAFTAGIAALNAKNFEEAIKQLQMAAEKDPAVPAIFANLALALSNAKKYDESVAAYRKSIALKPDDPAVHALLSLALANAGKIDEATQAVQEVAKLDPSMAGQSYYNLGAILTNRGRSKEAVAAFNKAIEIDPKNTQSYYQLGIAYFAATETIPQAIAALEKFLQLQPGGTEAEAAKQLIEAAKAQAPKGR
jgi:tetratricopeptide (TPR) repeat protein